MIRSAIVRRASVLAGASALFAGLATPRAGAQQLLEQYSLPGLFGPMGEAVGVLADTNGDGKSEFVVAGSVGAAVFSGDGYGKLFAVPFGLSGEEPLGLAGVGDLDGDGVPDFVAATAINIRAHSGADGHAIWIIPASSGSNFRVFIAALADLDGDGRPEVAVDETNAPSTPVVRVLSGVNGSAIMTLPGTGTSMSTIEWNASPGPELLVGEDDFVAHGTTTGRVRVIDPLTGATLFQVLGGANQHEGFSVNSPGDIDGDGSPDIVAGSQFVSGAMVAWSGTTGLVVWSVPTFFPFNLVAVGDETGDGVPDMVGGGPGGGAGGFGAARLISGATGGLLNLYTIGELTAFFRFVPAGDVDGDGKIDLFVGSAGGPFGGAVHSGRLFSLPNFVLINQFINPAGQTHLGMAHDRAGDLDGDGQGDVVLASLSGMQVFSGNGALLLSVDSPTVSLFGGSVSVAGCGDLDGDNVPDYALANGTFSANGTTSLEGRVRTHSGADGSILHSVQGGVAEELGWVVSATADIDGDGVRDLFASAPGAVVGGQANAGSVSLLSGSTLATLHVYPGDAVAQGRFGGTLAAAGDLDGDSVPDFAATSAHALRVISTGRGTELFRVTIGSGENMFGAVVGDADGDLVDDVLSREPDFVAVPPNGTGKIGRLRLWSGATHALLWAAQGTASGGQLGFNGGAAGDVNGDGYADVAATTNTTSFGTTSGTLWIYSGLDGSLLDQVVLPATGGNAGPVGPAGYVDAGGCGDVLVGLPLLQSNGGALAYRSAHGGVHGFVDLGFAKAKGNGVLPAFHGFGNLAAGGAISLRVRRAPASAPGIWFVGLAQGNVPFKGGTLVPAPGVGFFVIPFPSDVNGSVTINANNPAGVFAGLSLWHQFWFKDATASAGVAATNGLREIFK